MVKVKQKNASTPLNLAYGNNHFEPAESYSEITNLPIRIHNDDKKRKKTIAQTMNIKKTIFLIKNQKI
jgi:hypothetical protein